MAMEPERARYPDRAVLEPPSAHHTSEVCGGSCRKSWTVISEDITVIQVYAPTTNAEEAEVELFYEDLQDLLELTHKKDVLFIEGTEMQKKEVKKHLE